MEKERRTKLKKKLLVLVLVVAMVMVSFIGCSTTGPGEAKPSADTPSEAPAEVSEAPSSEAPAAPADEQIVVGLTLMDYNFPFFQDMLAMAKLTADKLGVKLIDLDGAGNVETQLTGVEDMVNGMGIDALFLNPVDTDAIGPATLEANEAGIPVVTVDVRSAQGDVVAHVASNNTDIGREAGKYAVQLLKEKYGSEKGTVLMMGYPQITSMRDRMAGFEEIIAQYPDIELIKRDPIDLNVQEALNLMDDLLQTYPEGKLDVVYGANATNAVGINSATEAAGRSDFAIIGVDDDPELLNALQREGSPFAATVVQYPTEMGRLGVEIAVAAAKGETIPEKEVATAIKLITRDTIKQFLDDSAATQEAIKPYK
jgi:ribose transport system substrate-binding protein